MKPEVGHAETKIQSRVQGWPFEYLGDRPDLAKAISLRAMWSVMKVDIRKRCASRGIDHRAFNVQWQTALSLITGTLIARKVRLS
jgi:hypothetical protein